MGKNKKKKNKNKESFMTDIDTSLDYSYMVLRDEIVDMQTRLNESDEDVEKKARKKMRKDSSYDMSDGLINNRLKIINEIESGDLMDRVSDFIETVSPLIKIICRLVCALICSILSIDRVKSVISESTLAKLDSIYSKVMSFA